MSEALVIPLGTKHLPEVREIFFESSVRKSFKDEIEREAFFEKYLGHYISRLPDFAAVAVLKEKVLGYVVASPETREEELFLLQPHLRVFQRYFDPYPAHLHMNCHLSARGHGIGTLLVESTVRMLNQRNIKGLHIMTAPGSRNVNFYRKMGFSFETEEEFQGSAILFMGKTISPNSL